MVIDLGLELHRRAKALRHRSLSKKWEVPGSFRAFYCCISSILKTYAFTLLWLSELIFGLTGCLQPVNISNCNYIASVNQRAEAEGPRWTTDEEDQKGTCSS